jgi:protein-disulfide isomerase
LQFWLPCPLGQPPGCKLVFVELKKLMAEDSDIRLVMKDWPIFGDVSRDAARVTLLTGEHYAAAVDALMTNQRGLSERRTNDILASVGVDVAMVRADLAIREPDIDAALLRTDTQATAFKLRGTPALVIGGSLYRRGMPVSELRQAVPRRVRPECLKAGRQSARRAAMGARCAFQRGRTGNEDVFRADKVRPGQVL